MSHVDYNDHETTSLICAKWAYAMVNGAEVPVPVLVRSKIVVVIDWSEKSVADAMTSTVVSD